MSRYYSMAVTITAAARERVDAVKQAAEAEWAFGDWFLDDAGEGPCDCERPGHFCSGVPGILAHMEHGRVAPGAKVERCGLCRRYPTDEAALKKLRELGYSPS